MKSGIEMIEEILKKINTLDRRFNVLEQNTKELLNRANTKESIKTADSPKIAPAKEVKIPKTQKETVKVFGKVHNKEGKIIIGVNINIEDENGNLIKQTKTNRAGEWMCFLPIGNYKAHYVLEKLIDTTVTFSVKPESKMIRVSQPKE